MSIVEHAKYWRLRGIVTAAVDPKSHSYLLHCLKSTLQSSQKRTRSLICLVLVCAEGRKIESRVPKQVVSWAGKVTLQRNVPFELNLLSVSVISGWKLFSPAVLRHFCATPDSGISQSFYAVLQRADKLQINLSFLCNEAFNGWSAHDCNSVLCLITNKKYFPIIYLHGLEIVVIFLQLPRTHHSLESRRIDSR